MSGMADDKPLPDIPDLTTLSVDARNHRAALIGHFLNELHEPEIESRRNEWLHAFEGVLDDLGRYISNGDGLNSIKRGKELKKVASKIKCSETFSEPQHSKTPAEDPESGLGVNADTKSLPEVPNIPLQQLRSLASAPPPPPGEPRSCHLVLCLTPHETCSPLPKEDNGFDILPASIGCTLSVGNFLLHDHDENANILFGLDDLDANMWGSALRLVGGTFTFKGVNSPSQHQLLSRILKLAIYIHLSLILEQHLLSDVGVQLMFTRLKVSHSSPSTSANMATNSPIAKEVRLKARKSFLPSGFAKFLSKHNLRYRGAQTMGESGGRGSLDLTFAASDQGAEALHRRVSLGNSPEGHFGGRLRRLSLIADKRYSFLRGHHRESSYERREPVIPQPFTSALKRIEGSKGFLSTSLGVNITSPKVIIDLADKERATLPEPETDGQRHARRLRGDERVALSSLRGWEGKDAEGAGMSGLVGFLRQQAISVLVSLHPAISTDAGSQQRSASTSVSSSASDGYSTIQSNSGFSNFTAETTSTIVPSHLWTKFAPCNKPSWITYRYYSGEDPPLGDWVLDVAKHRNSPCPAKSRCNIMAGRHETRIIHDGLRIVIKIEEDFGDKRGSDAEEGERQDNKLADDKIEVWESCLICNAKTSRKTMNTGTRLFSYAKYLELLLYSPLICTLTSPLCEHTSPPPLPWATCPSSRFNIIRHFAAHSADISFALSAIEDVFELRVPRLQLTRGVDKAVLPFTKLETTNVLDQKKALRRDIRKWWEGVSDHIDRIEGALTTEAELFQKALPRLPSGDDAYDVFDEAEAQSNIPSPTFSALLPPSVPPTSPKTPSEDIQNESSLTTISNASSEPQTPKPPVVPSKDDSEQLLASLRQNFQRIERSLYSQLAKTPETSLNDVRRAFLFSGKGTQKRLRAWQDKHLGSTKSKLVGDPIATEPEWWEKGCHVVPNGNILVRENDWGSIIAHTLSTVDYQLEMANLSSVSSGSHPNQTASSGTAQSTTSSTFFSLNTGYRLFTSSSKSQPDPDQENVVWNEPEQYTSAISRKEHGRDLSALPYLRDVLGRKVTPDGQTNSDSVTATRNELGPNAAKAKADIAINPEDVAGLLSRPNVTDTATEKEDKVLHDSDDPTPTNSRPETPKPHLTIAASSGVPDDPNGKAKASSVHSAESEDNQDTDTIRKDGPQDAVATTTLQQSSSLPPPLPPKQDSETDQEKETPTASHTTATQNAHPDASSNSSRFTTTLTSGLNNAVKYVLSAESPSRFLVRSLSNTKKRAGMHSIDDRPHIKYEWMIGKRVKFNCTVYYAKQFDVLRKKCGVHDTFVASLSRSTNWAAEGGKSKSNFWKTTDDRFIIKTLVNAWNVADLQVLIEHAPSYFRYMDATASKATVLVKLLGFYTIEIKNLESGTIQAKADLLVMENLFYGQKISRTFDLKGIHGRKVKSRGNGNRTLFDSEWIEGQKQTLTLLRPHSKAILREAIKNDASFLARSNIMDYSLLLGIDDEKKEMVCGLVDTIGSYTFAKTLEYKAKHGLQAGKEVTVMPPAEYQERLVNALDGYFVACPDRWSKALDESKVLGDLNLLSSVL